MSGHSKWSKVKHQKATTDVVKSASFTKATHAITIAVKEGGGITDPNHNFHLRLAIEKAREVNMPKENIERAISRAVGDSKQLEQLYYEAFGPGGVALLIQAVTENRTRTVSFIKNILVKGGGHLATPGSVLYQFTKTQTAYEPKSEMLLTLDSTLKEKIDSLLKDLLALEDVHNVYTTIR